MHIMTLFGSRENTYIFLFHKCGHFYKCSIYFEKTSQTNCWKKKGVRAVEQVVMVSLTMCERSHGFKH